MGENDYLMEHPVFTYDTLNQSIADLIQETFPNSSVYDSPVRAGKKLPRWFILYRNPNKNIPEVNRTIMKRLSLDIVYEQDYNLINLYDDYREKGSIIEEVIHKKLSYNIRNQEDEIIKKIPLDAHDIEISIDQAGMHCYFTLLLRIIDKEVYDQKYIETIDWQINVTEKDNGKN